MAGGFVNPLYDGLLEYEVDRVGTRSEQEAGFLACMQARVSRQPAVCIAEPSGFTNYIIATHYPTGPVQLSIPVDFLYSGYVTKPETTGREIDTSQTKVSSPYPDPDDVDKVVKELDNARTPVIVAGGEAIWYENAESELQAFSSQTKIPVFNPIWHIKMHDLTHEFNIGLADIHQNPASRLIYEESDLILFLDCPIDFTLDFAEPPMINKNTKLITVNSSAGELVTNHIANEFIISGTPCDL